VLKERKPPPRLKQTWSGIRIRINSVPDVCQVVDSHLVGVSHFAECRESGCMRNAKKSPKIHYGEGNEKVSRNPYPVLDHHQKCLVGPIITPLSLNEIGW